MVRKKEDILADGMKTRFKKGNTVQKDTGAKPYSARSQLAWAMAQDVDPHRIKQEIERLKTMKVVKGKSVSNIARLFALAYLEKALLKKDSTLFDKILDQTEGKLSQEIIIPATLPAPVDNASVEDAAAAYAAHIGK